MRPVQVASAAPVAASRKLSTPALLAVSIASFGGPLALAALYAPTIVADTTASAGLVAVAAAVVFGFPLVIWLQYTKRVSAPGGLYAFVRAAAGPRVAGIQAALWLLSYVLYLVYTTASVVYETLPTVLPGVRPWRPVLEIAIPVVLAAVMLAGRTATIAALGVLALAQLLLVGVMAGVGLTHDAPASAFVAHGGAGEFGTATGQIALLYVCGSLPLFLIGEARPAPMRRALTGGFLVTAVGVVAAVVPLAADPAFAQAPIPGMSLVEVFAGRPWAVAVGLGVAASVVGVMLAEFLAVSRLTIALMPRWPLSAVIKALSAALVVSAPITLVSPERIYDDLLKPSLAALWLSQLMVFVVYPRLANGGGRYLLAAVGAAFAGYGLYATFTAAST